MLDDETENDEPESEGKGEGLKEDRPDEESEHGDSDTVSDKKLGDRAPEVPAAVRKLYKLFTGRPHPLTESRIPPYPSQTAATHERYSQRPTT